MRDKSSGYDQDLEEELHTWWTFVRLLLRAGLWLMIFLVIIGMEER